MAFQAYPRVQDLIDDYVNNKVPNGANVGVVMGVVTPVQPAGEMLFGGTLVNRATPPQPMTLSGATLFELGSVSKVFATGIFAMLTKESSFADTLSSALGNALTMSSYVGGITLGQLASYGSGLPQDNGSCKAYPCTGYPPGMVDSLEALFTVLANYSPNQPGLAPGAYYTYSNLAIVLLSLAALKWQNLYTAKFVAALNDKLIAYCKQFGVDTGSAPTTTVYSPDIAASLPLGYTEAFSPTTQAPCQPLGNASGGIVSTGNDMLQFLLYQMSTKCARYLQDEQAQRTNFCDNDASTITSFGWILLPFNVNNKQSFLVSKDGGVPGFSAWIGFESRASQNDASPCGLFVLSNGQDATSLGLSAFKVITGGSL